MIESRLYSPQQGTVWISKVPEALLFKAVTIIFLIIELVGHCDNVGHEHDKLFLASPVFILRNETLPVAEVGVVRDRIQELLISVRGSIGAGEREVIIE